MNATTEKNKINKKKLLSDERIKRFLAKYDMPKELTESDSLSPDMIGAVFRKRAVRIIALTVTFILCFSVIKLCISPRCADAVIMLNYEKSSNGLAPNETRFCVSDLKSKDTAELIIEKAGLEGKITADELNDCIALSPAVAKMSNDEFYMPTSYRITLSLPESIKGMGTEKLMGIICDIYSEYFNDRYTMNTGSLSESYNVIDEIEYVQAGEYLKMRLDAIYDFLEMRAGQGERFISSDGETFMSLMKKVSNIRDIELKAYNAYVWENGVSRNGESYADVLSYKNKIYEREKAEAEKEYRIRIEAIEEHDGIMAASVLVPTVNGNDEYYTARTKTGVDRLAVEAEYYLALMKNYEFMIKNGEDRISKLDSGPADKMCKTADEMINNIIDETESIVSLVLNADKEFREAFSENSITFEIESAGIFKRLPLKNIILYSALFALLLFGFYVEQFRFIVKRGKKR